MESKVALILIVLLVGGAFFVSNSGLSGAAVSKANRIDSVSTKCVYENDLSYYVSVKGVKTGNQFCRLKGYDYAAFVDKSAGRILFDTLDQSCFSGGKIQVDEIVYYYKAKESDDISNWQNNYCTSFGGVGTEPELGDIWQSFYLDGALCCY